MPPLLPAAGLIGASIIGVLVYVKFFKGGPAVAAALRNAGAAPCGGGVTS